MRRPGMGYPSALQDPNLRGAAKAHMNARRAGVTAPAPLPPLAGAPPPPSVASAATALLGIVPTLGSSDINMLLSAGSARTATATGAGAAKELVAAWDCAALPNVAPSSDACDIFGMGAPDTEWWDRPYLRSGAAYALGAAPWAQTPAGVSEAAEAAGGAEAASAHSIAAALGTVDVGASASPAARNVSVKLSALRSMAAVANPAPTAPPLLERAVAVCGLAPPAATPPEAAVVSAKTPEELKRERHQRRVAAAAAMQLAAQQRRANDATFGAGQRFETPSAAADAAEAGGPSGAEGDSAASSGAAAPDATGKIGLSAQDVKALRELGTTAARHAVEWGVAVGAKHLRNMFRDDVLAAEDVRSVIDGIQQRRVEEHLRRNDAAHSAALARQVDHKWDVARRAALVDPRALVFRVVDLGDPHLVNRLKIYGKDRLLRGVLVWIGKRHLIGVVAGGRTALREFEHFVVDVQRAKFDAARARADVLWTGVLSDFAFRHPRCLFAEELSPFEGPDWVAYRKPAGDEKRKLKAATATAAGKKGDEDAAAEATKELDHRGRFESLTIKELDGVASAVNYMVEAGLSQWWDLAVFAPIHPPRIS